MTPQSVKRALDNARSGPLDEASVGGGTGMNCYAFKGGTGTASRRVLVGSRQYTVGAFMPANFGSRNEFVLAGRHLGLVLSDDNPMEETDWLAPPGAGSCITVVATDAPLLSGQCKALARRVPLGLARTGTTGSHFSGDLFLAFSATNIGALDSSLDAPSREAGTPPSIEFVPWGQMDRPGDHAAGRPADRPPGACPTGPASPSSSSCTSPWTSSSPAPAPPAPPERAGPAGRCRAPARRWRGRR